MPERGAAPEVGVCSGYDHLSVLPSGGPRIIATITQAEVVRKLLCHLKLATDRRLLPRLVLAKKRSLGAPKPTLSASTQERRACSGGMLTPLSV